MSDDIAINQWVKDIYGCDITGKPKFRVSWTTGQLEKIHGRFNVFYGEIFVREEVGVKEQPKYPYDKDRWVLEKLEYNTGNAQLTENYSYEPIFIFKDKHGLFLPLERKVVALILFQLHHIGEEAQIRTSMEEADVKSMDAEIDYFRQKLGEGQPLYAKDLVE